MLYKLILNYVLFSQPHMKLHLVNQFAFIIFNSVICGHELVIDETASSRLLRLKILSVYSLRGSRVRGIGE